MSNTPSRAELPPRDLEMEARSMDAYRNGDSIPLQQYIFELRVDILKGYMAEHPSTLPADVAIQEAVYELFIRPLQEKIALLEKYKQAIELMENGSVQAVSVLDLGGYNMTVKSGIASISATYDGVPLVDAIISAGKAYMQ
jgi:hypothetical protein